MLGGACTASAPACSRSSSTTTTASRCNATFAAYALPSAAEVPEIRTAFVESPSPRNPLGAKGIGEGGAIGVPAALGNAVADALGGLPRRSPLYAGEALAS